MAALARWTGQAALKTPGGLSGKVREAKWSGRRQKSGLWLWSWNQVGLCSLSKMSRLTSWLVRIRCWGAAWVDGNVSVCWGYSVATLASSWSLWKSHALKAALCAAASGNRTSGNHAKTADGGNMVRANNVNCSVSLYKQRWKLLHARDHPCVSQ